MQPEIDTLPAVRELSGEITQLESFVHNYHVTTPAQYSAGGDDLKRVKAAQKKLEDTRTGITGPMNAALKKVNDFFRAPTERLTQIERAIKSKLLAYADEQARLQREEQRKQDEVARKERERLQAIADKAASTGNEAKAEKFSERAATVVAPIVNREPPKVTGLSMRQVWKFEVTDPAAVPREYLLVDETKIRKVVTALKGETVIAGVRVYAENQMASGAA